MLETAYNLALSNISVRFWVKKIHPQLEAIEIPRGVKLTEALLFCEVIFNIAANQGDEIDILR